MTVLRTIVLTLALAALPRALHAQHDTLPAGGRGGSPHGPSLREACSTCHAPDAWKPARIAKSFRHAERTFPLAGAHASATCGSCHRTLDFSQSSTTCARCHDDVHHGELGAECARCHTSRAFVDRSTMTRMHQVTRFPLRAAHAAVACESCHPPARAGQLQYVKTNTLCSGCHMPDFRAAASPPHAEPAFSLDCTACHSGTSWRGAAFDHAATQFPLTGGHRAVSCEGCHADGAYRGKPMTCVSCHLSRYDATTNPNHRTSGFSTACETCHTTTAWPGGAFSHDATRFPLTGAHRTAVCTNCHGDGVFAGKPTTCVNCHTANYSATTTPHHAAAGFVTSCESCHGTAAWRPVPYDHSRTSFPLTGAHAGQTCLACHASKVYDGLPSECVACHQARYDATTSPGHRSAGFPTTCATCHNTNAWLGAPFDHAATQFPLTGGHRAVSCQGCHADGVYRGKPTTCVSCHLATYDATANPNHKASGFSTACETCHTTTTWPGAAFNHDVTKFPLTGAHRAATCSDCHSDGVFAGKPTTCVNCHTADYSATTTPHHAAAGFLTSCESCHGTTAWRPVPYDHSRTSFPLTGAHVGQSCLACHASKVYDGLPAECVSCHRTDYDATTNPRHATAMFPTTCASCHNTVQWLGATFAHDANWFPIYSGKHAGRWSTCAECHTSPSNFQQFTCLTCHPHSDKPKTDGNHQGQAGYAYDSIRCYACHPRGTH